MNDLVVHPENLAISLKRDAGSWYAGALIREWPLAVASLLPDMGVRVAGRA